MIETSMQIKTAEDLFDVAKFASEGKHLVWFRGQKRVRDDLGEWKLRPQIHRPWLGPTGKTVYYKHTQEMKMALLFKTQAISRHGACPSDGEHGKWLTLMQHYGMPTRLIDWTESVLVAAFFAVEDANPNDQPGVIWALKPYQLNKVITGAASILILEMYTASAPTIIIEAFQLKNPTKGILAAVGYEVDMRMMIQQSRFTIHGSPEPLEDHPNADQFLNRFEILPSAKKALREDLFAAGIRHSTLFPDLSYLAKDISSRIVPPDGNVPGE